MMIGEYEEEAPASEVDSSTNEATHTSITATTAGAETGELELPESVPPPPEPLLSAAHARPQRTQVTQTNESLRPLRISDTSSQTDYFTRISSPEIHYGVEASSRNNRLYMSHSAQSRSRYQLTGETQTENFEQVTDPDLLRRCEQQGIEATFENAQLLLSRSSQTYPTLRDARGAQTSEDPQEDLREELAMVAESTARMYVELGARVRALLAVTQDRFSLSVPTLQEPIIRGNLPPWWEPPPAPSADPSQGQQGEIAPRPVRCLCPRCHNWVGVSHRRFCDSCFGPDENFEYCCCECPGCSHFEPGEKRRIPTPPDLSESGHSSNHEPYNLSPENFPALPKVSKASWK